MAQRDGSMSIPVAEVVVPEGRRPLNDEAVRRLAQGIKEVGLQHPITVRSVCGTFRLVAGAHRLAAFQRIGEDFIPATIVKMDDEEAEMWEISENLHRSELSTIERAENIERWRELKALKVREVSAPTPGGQQPNDKGYRKTAADLGVDEAEVRSAGKIAGLTDEAKAAARDVGLDDNRTRLLAAAKVEPSRQADTIRDLADRKASKIDADVKGRAAQEAAEIIAEYVPAEAWDGLKANLYAAGANAIANALTNITGQSVMDRRYGS